MERTDIGMAQWYSRADRERMAQGLPPQEHSALTVEDYRDLVEFALEEAVERSPAKDLIGSARVGDLGGKYAGVTQNDGNAAGKYAVTVDWGDEMQSRAADPKDGPAYVAQRFTSAFHEVRHVEQRALMSGILPIGNRLDMEVATQMTVNDLYPTVYGRGYGNTVTEVDADVAGVEGALAFFDAHPEIKERYGFDFRKEIMRTDEYDVLEDRYQVTRATPEELLSGMQRYRDGVYEDPWKADRAGLDHDVSRMGKLERALMEHLEDVHGVTWDDLEKMPNDERNVLLIQNAVEAIDDPDIKLGYDMKAFREGPVMEGRLDEVIRDENEMLGLVQMEKAPAAALPERPAEGPARSRGHAAAARFGFAFGHAEAGVELALG